MFQVELVVVSGHNAPLLLFLLQVRDSTCTRVLSDFKVNRLVVAVGAYTFSFPIVGELAQVTSFATCELGLDRCFLSGHVLIE